MPMTRVRRTLETTITPKLRQPHRVGRKKPPATLQAVAHFGGQRRKVGMTGQRAAPKAEARGGKAQKIGSSSCCCGSAARWERCCGVPFRRTKASIASDSGCSMSKSPYLSRKACQRWLSTPLRLMLGVTHIQSSDHFPCRRAKAHAPTMVPRGYVPVWSANRYPW
ncbi:hypothetical protein D3C78_1429640 [compost metagenome]